jgi:acetyl-CoA carboxylase carboxyl transferase subunit alpha
MEFGVIDEIVPEPAGGAHVNHDAIAGTLRETLAKHIEELRRIKPEKLVRRRREKFLKMGAFQE